MTILSNSVDHYSILGHQSLWTMVAMAKVPRLIPSGAALYFLLHQVSPDIVAQMDPGERGTSVT